MTQKRRNEITGLRGLSACAIAYIFHYTELFHTMPERFPIQAAVMGFLARYGVCMSEIFFMLSGLLLYWSYQKRLSEGELRLGSFILPKMKKIYPMMMASALVTWLLQKVGYAIYGVYILHPDGAGVRNSLKALLVSLLGLQTGWISDNDTLAVNGPSWFVSVFFVCYAIYYLLTRYVRGRLWQNVSYMGMMALGIFLMIHPLGLPLFCRHYTGTDHRKDQGAGQDVFLYIGKCGIDRQSGSGRKTREPADFVVCQRFCVDKSDLSGMSGGYPAKDLWGKTFCLAGKCLYADLFVEYGD